MAILCRIDEYRLNPMRKWCVFAKSTNGTDKRSEYTKCHELREKRNIETPIKFANPANCRRWRTIRHWCRTMVQRATIVEIILRWLLYRPKTTPAYLWTFLSTVPTPSSQSLRWHCRHPSIGLQVKAICVEVNQFVPLSFAEKKEET